MQQHPIPQDITGYKFHIVGNMTLKQFAEIALSCIIAMVIYKTNLVAIVKWPMIVMSVGLGIIAAFVPIAERPLDHWITTFIKILYKPTKFYWKKNSMIPQAFIYQPEKDAVKPGDEIDLSPARRERISEYLTSIDGDNLPEDWEIDEANKISSIMGSFKDVHVSHAVSTPIKAKPRLGIRVRKMKPAGELAEASPQNEVVIFQNQSQPNDGLGLPPYPTQLSPEEQMVLENRQEINQKAQNQVDEVAKHISIPQEEIITTNVAPIKSSVANKAPEKAEAKVSQSVYVKNQTPTQTVTASQQVVYNQNLPFPSKPTKANVVVGMVVTPKNELITDAIVQILNPSGNILRAVKTNALGQFFISTPLESGKYIVEVEKEGYNFQPQNLVLEEKIIDPLEIRSI